MFCSVIVNAMIIGFGLTAMIIAVINNFDGMNTNMLIMFTNDSNVILLLSSVIMLVLGIKGICKKTYEFSIWARIIRLCGVLGTTLTFLIVMFYLLPIFGTAMISWYSMTALHIICPVLGLVSFLFFEHGKPIKIKFSVIGIIPIIVYAITIIPLVALNVISAPYPFLDIYNQAVFVSILWFAGILGCSYLLSLLLVFLNNLLSKK